MYLDASVDVHVVRGGDVQRCDEPQHAVAEADGREVVDGLDH